MMMDVIFWMDAPKEERAQHPAFAESSLAEIQQAGFFLLCELFQSRWGSIGFDQGRRFFLIQPDQVA